MNAIIDFILALLVVISVGLQKTYSEIPVKEVKRRARAGNKLYKNIYRAASYGQSLRALLWLFTVAFSAVFFVVVGRNAPTWFAFSASASLIWAAYVWLPNSPVSILSQRIAVWSAPALALLLNHMHPFLHRINSIFRGSNSIPIHTGLYEKVDLINLLKQQQAQTDNRIDSAELEIAISALNFGEQLVRKHLTPRRIVKTIKLDESVGPILMAELHASGHSRFPVHDGKKDNIVGTLYLRDLVSAKATGTVKDIMKANISYVHEEQNLYDALQSIIKTHHHLLVVVNSFEEYVGIITLEDIMEQIVGKPIIDEFDQYQDLRAVAARAAKLDLEEHQKTSADDPEDVTITSDETTK